MSNGIITLKTPIDITATEAEQRAALAAEKKKQDDKTKTNAQRQAAYRKKMKDAGWTKIYVDPSTIQTAEELGGIELVLDHHNKWMHRAITAEATILKLEKALIAIKNHRKPWWKFW